MPVLSKLFEKLFLELFPDIAHDILSSGQFGFRENKCTADAVTSLIDDIAEGLERREEVLTIFLDLSKAFNYVHHRILLKKLEGFGVCDLALEWIK